MKISVSSYSFNQYIIKGKMTMLGTVKAAAELGFSGIEFTDLPGATQKERLEYAALLKSEAEKYGIAIVAYCVGARLYHETKEAADAAVREVMEKVDVAAALGAPVMRHDVTWSERFQGRTVSFERQLPMIAENARRITEYAASLGIKTCSENHGMVAQDSDRFERLYNAVGHDNYGLLIDIGNFACVDESSITAVSRVAPYAFHVHAKDFYITPFGAPNPYPKGFNSRGMKTLTGAAVGEGDIPVKQCMAILNKAGYDAYVSIEYEGFKDPIDELRLAKSNLEGYIKF